MPEVRGGNTWYLPDGSVRIEPQDEFRVVFFFGRVGSCWEHVSLPRIGFLRHLSPSGVAPMHRFESWVIPAAGVTTGMIALGGDDEGWDPLVSGVDTLERYRFEGHYSDKYRRSNLRVMGCIGVAHSEDETG